MICPLGIPVLSILVSSVVGRYSRSPRQQTSPNFIEISEKFRQYNRVTTGPAPPELIKEIKDHVGYASIAYCNKNRVSISSKYSQSIGVGTILIGTISDVNLDTQAFLSVNFWSNEIVLSFRGSHSIRKLLFAADQETIPYPFAEGALVTKNVYNSIEYIRNFIMDRIVYAKSLWTGYRFVIVGHSLGGSLATLMAPVVAKDLNMSPKDIRVITYNQPRAGNKAFAVHYNSLGFNFTRVTNKDDPVHDYPSMKDGWAHVHREVYINEDNNFFICGTDKLEDPKCSYHTGNWFAVFYNHGSVGELKIGMGDCELAFFY